MIYAYLYRIVLLVLNFKSYLMVTEINRLQYESNKAIKEKNFVVAQGFLNKITEITYIDSPEIRFNQALINLNTGKSFQAMAELENLSKISDKNVAYQAAMAVSQIKLEKKDSLGALAILKPALLETPPPINVANRYEWLKRQLPITNKKLQSLEKKIKIKSENSQVEISNRADQLLVKSDEQLSKEQTLEFIENLHQADVENLKKTKKITNKKSSTNW
jgi:predicted Zn-dependent protease